MKMITGLLSMTLVQFALIPSCNALSIIDLNTQDLNRVLSQHQNGDLVVSLDYGAPSDPFDSILILDSQDLGQPLAGLWFDIRNSTFKDWIGYRFEFYDPSFSTSLRLPLNSLFVGPQSPTQTFSEWVTTPNFNADTISLTGGTGVDGGQAFTVIFTFNIPTLLDNYPAENGELKLGIRQRASAVPDNGSTLGLLSMGILFFFAGPLFAQRTTRDA